MKNGNVFVAMAALAFSSAIPAAGVAVAAEQTAILAGGCFWCIEKDFEHVAGVKEAVSGYTGGDLLNPTYRNHGNHVEAVRIVYDDAKVSYGELLRIFWRSVDPTDAGGQFCDRGHSYTTAIFPLGDEQMKTAVASKAELEASGRLGAPIVTTIAAAGTFTDAEDYHQDYYKKNPLRYRYYRNACGRDARVEELWGDEAHSGIEKGS